MRSYFFGSGIILAFLYLIAAAFLIRIFGVEITRYWSTVMMAAGVLLGGTYGVFLLVWIVVHISKRLLNRQPITDVEG